MNIQLYEQVPLLLSPGQVTNYVWPHFFCSSRERASNTLNHCIVFTFHPPALVVALGDAFVAHIDVLLLLLLLLMVLVVV